MLKSSNFIPSPTLFLDHNGIRVYHVYKFQTRQGRFTRRVLDYWYTLDPVGKTDPEAFDIRRMGIKGLIPDPSRSIAAVYGEWLEYVRAEMRDRIDQGCFRQEVSGVQLDQV